MKIVSIFQPSKYINKISSIKESINKAQIVKELINSDISPISLYNIWKLEKYNAKTEFPLDISEYVIFGTPIDDYEFIAGVFDVCGFIKIVNVFL